MILHEAAEVYRRYVMSTEPHLREAKISRELEGIFTGTFSKSLVVTSMFGRVCLVFASSTLSRHGKT